MAIEFRPTPFNDYEAFSGECLIGGIEQRDNGSGNTEWCWSLGMLPPTPRWQTKGHKAPDLETAMQALRISFKEWLECADLIEKKETEKLGV
jgi:hypothetical protein